MIGNTVIRRIRSYIRSKSEKLKDSNLKNSIPAVFIKEYSIVLSFIIIVIGFGIIFSSFDKTISNTISMTPILETHGSVLEHSPSSVSSVDWFNPKNESPIYDVKIGVEYKEPLGCGNSLKINGIEMNIKPDIVKDVDLHISLHGFKSENKDFNLNPKNGVNMSEGIKSYMNSTLVSEFRTLAFDKYNGDSIISDQKSYDNFEFTYLLEYSLLDDFENRSFSINGNADTYYPIKCMDYVTETNINISKFLLRLTGVLIILGAFPFVAALKQLLDKDK